MKEIIQKNYNGVDSLEIMECQEVPVTPASIIIKNKYVPVLPFDWMSEYGLLKEMRPVELPIVIGTGFGGIVEQVGALNDEKLIGKNVIGACPQGTARTAFDAQDSFFIEVPESVALRDAVTIIGGADAALNAVQSMEVKKGDTVLVTGASGGVGVYLLQLLKLREAHVIALASPKNVDFVKALGADEVIDYTADLPSQLEKIQTPTKIMDTVGKPEILEALSEQFEELRFFSLSLPQFQTKKEYQTFHFSQKGIEKQDYQELLQLMEAGNIHAVIQKIFPFTDVKEAHLESKEGSSNGRILLEF